MIDYFKWIGPLILLIAAALMQTSCSPNPNINVYETSQSGHKLSLLKDTKPLGVSSDISLNLNQKFQTISGFGGAFTAKTYQLTMLNIEKTINISPQAVQTILISN